MGYDALNRLKSKNYTLSADTAATAAVTYQYDQGGFKGALSLASTTGSNTSYAYDGFGRVSGSTQTTNNGTQPVAYAFAYQYSLTDQLTQITYPSGRTISYGLDAADRVNMVKNVGTGTNYASNIQYSALGGILSMTMGNGVQQQLSWNDRAQPTNLQVTSGATSLLTLGFYPCAGNAVTSCPTGNNGNLQSQTITQPGLNLTQNYTYDKLNRLSAATELASPGSMGWTQNYGYDVSGNRWLVLPNDPNLPLTLETPTGSLTASTWYSSSVSNRINSWTYDAAGNVTQVGSMDRHFTYDAENRQASFTINSNPSTYTYDGNGFRVGKTSGGNTTFYVYDAFGNLAAEYSSQTAPSACDTNTCYTVLDHLGSTRMLTDANGSSTVTRYDYLPFGQELLASTNGRTTGMGYLGSADGTNPKFTGKNRDGETFLDWFEVRYMSGAQGRFQSVDPGNAGANPGDPQTWNMYSYVGNNPLSYTDPSGEGFGSDFFGVLAGIGTFLATGSPVAGAAVGWDVANGQPPGLDTFGIGGGIIGGISGGVNSGQPWNEQPPIGLNIPGPLFGAGCGTDGVCSVRPADQGVVDYNVENFIAGLSDSFSFGWTRNTRTQRGLQQADFCSGAYQAGEWTPVVAGGLRLAYAGAAKAIPLIVGGSTDGALDAVAVRNSLKVLFRSPASWFSSSVRNYRIYDPAATVAKRGAAGAIAGAAKTNGYFNGLGAVFLGGGATNTVTQPSACR